MPIDKTTPSNNIGVIDIPLYQNWVSQDLNLVKSINITQAIPASSQTVNVKDVIGSYIQYSQFRLKMAKSYSSGGIAWIKPFVNSLNGVPAIFATVPLTQNSSAVTFTIELQNENALPLGYYEFIQTFTIQALNGPGQWVDISTHQHKVKFNLVNDLALFNPKSLTYSHIIGTTLPVKEVIVNGTSWDFIGNPKFTLSSDSPNVTIQAVANSEGPFQIANGTGIGVVKITLGSHFNSPPEPGTILFPLSVDYLQVRSGIELVGSVAVKVRKFFREVFTLSPNTLHFVAAKNINDAAAKDLLFECNVAYTIEASPWLETTVQTVLIDGVPKQVITVLPLSSFNMEAGIYTGFVTATATINGTVQNRKTIVTYEVSDVAQFPYDSDQLAFTLDNKFINLLTFNSGTYMQMIMTVKAFDFYTNEERLFTVNEKIGLFQGKAKVNIGKTIHQILSRDKAINDNLMQYKPAILSIAFLEKSIADDEFIREMSFNDFRFVAGLSANFNKFGFFKFNHLMERVTDASEKWLNFFVPSGMHKMLTYKNNSLYSEVELLPSDGNVMSLKVDFASFTQGDKIDFAIRNSSSQQCSKVSFVVFPEGMHSNHITWEDEFLLKQTMECTGVYNVKAGLSFISQTKYKGLVEHLSHLDISKVSKITINTGWLMQSDVDSVESLMRSKKVWINGNGKTIFLVPISDSITSQDSQRELVDYTLEFQINPNFNEETYSL